GRSRSPYERLRHDPTRSSGPNLPAAGALSEIRIEREDALDDAGSVELEVGPLDRSGTVLDELVRNPMDATALRVPALAVEGPESRASEPAHFEVLLQGQNPRRRLARAAEQFQVEGLGEAGVGDTAV